MATVTGLTADRMQEIIDATIVDADVIGDNLILTKDDGSTIDAGNVRGPAGADGTTGALPRVNVLPGSPGDGTEIAYVASVTNGVVWHLKYNAGSSSPYKWEFVGGGDLYHEIDTNEILTGAGAVNYSDLATVGPTLTPPLAGDYLLGYGAEAFNAVAAITMVISLAFNGNVATDADRMSWSDGAAAQPSPGSRHRKKTLNAAQAVTVKYKVPSWSSGRDGNWRMRWMTMRPIRVGQK